MKRAFLLTVAGVLLAGCGSSRPTGSNLINYRPHVPKSDVTPLANRREHAAVLKAQRLLRQVSLPPGAVRVAAPAPSDVMAQSGLGVSTVNMTAERYSLWSVSRSPAWVLGFERRHMLPGLRGEGRASAPDGWESEAFYAPSVRGLPSQRAVSVTVEPGGGGTTLRLDAGVSWIYPRSPREVVPAGVREIDINGAGVNMRVTRPALVQRIVRWFDALNVMQPGPAVSCAAVAGHYLRFAFRSGNRGTLATAQTDAWPATNCNTIQFWIRGALQTPLIDARLDRGAFVARVQRLLGISFSPPRHH